MWNTFPGLHSRFKIYKENYSATFAKPKKHLKARQREMFHGDRLGLLSVAHKAVGQPALRHEPPGDAALGTPTGSEGQEDAPHVHELVVVSVPAALPACPLASAVHPERKQLSTLKPTRQLLPGSRHGGQ